MSAVTDISPADTAGQLHRTIDWRGAFWVASGVPPLVLFSIGGIAGTAGNIAFAIWIFSMLMGFIQSFTYAEIAGLFPNKSGGASVYGATAWLRYSKFVAPLSVWCNWFAWSPVLSLGCSIAAAYILNALAPIPGFTETSPEVLQYLTANVGTTAADAVAAVTAAATPASAPGRCTAIRWVRSASRSTPPSGSALS
jgi:amino acid transporter